MQKIFVEHIFQVSRERFVEELFFSEGFNVAAHAFMNFRKREVLSDEDTPDQRYLKIEYVTGEKLPWVARKLFGHDDVGWIEELVFDKRTWTAQIAMRGHILADRITSRGVMRFFEHAEDQTRRTFEIDVHVGVPGVGRAIEKKMLADTERNFEAMAGFTRRWIRDHGLACAV